jgi:hypothetical protein
MGAQMNHSRTWGQAIVALIAVVLVFAGATAFASTFKCVDEKGNTLYGDTMPPQCANKPITEFSGQGSIKKKYEGPLTPEQLKARDEETAKRQEAERLIAEQRRKDAALLSTYGSEKDFDVARERTYEQIKVRMDSAGKRLKDTNERLDKLLDELDFYKAGKSRKSAAREPPAPLVQNIERTTAERAALELSLKNLDEEKNGVRERVEKDRARWKELKVFQNQVRKQ